VNADEIPQQLIDILDARAGKVHSRQGPVVACLAEILTAYDWLKLVPILSRTNEEWLAHLAAHHPDIVQSDYIHPAGRPVRDLISAHNAAHGRWPRQQGHVHAAREVST
jgi:hypothetical protein